METAQIFKIGRNACVYMPLNTTQPVEHEEIQLCRNLTIITVSHQIRTLIFAHDLISCRDF